MLRSAGFLTVTLYEEYGDAESKIADPVMIYDCGLKGRVLLTGDQELPYTWAKEIVEARIAVFRTTNNNEGPKQWGQGSLQRNIPSCVNYKEGKNLSPLLSPPKEGSHTLAFTKMGAGEQFRSLRRTLRISASTKIERDWHLFRSY